MNYLGRFVTKDVLECQPGELIAIHRSGELIFCLIIEAEAESEEASASVTVGALNGNFRLKAVRFTDRAPCLSYGLDWVLVPELGPETYARNLDLFDSAGVLHVDGNALLLAFRESQTFTTLHFDLRQNQLVRDGPSQLAAPVSVWRIFASEQDWRHKATSLFEMTAA